MKKFLLVLLSLSVITGVILVIGCSDDDETTQPIVKQTGDLSDPEYLATDDALGFVEFLNGMMFNNMFMTMDSAMMNPAFHGIAKSDYSGMATGIASDTIFLTYHSGSDYWYLWGQAVDTETVDTQQVIITMTIADSVQFLHGMTPVQWPDSALLTGVKHGASLEYSTDNNILSVDAHQLITVTGDLPGYGDIEVDGSSSFDAYVSEASGGPGCTFDLNLGSTVTDLLMNLETIDAGGCPYSGRTAYNGAINMTCIGDTSFTFNDYWSIVQTFTGSSIHYVVENSTHRWEFDESCGGIILGPENPILEFLDPLP